MSDDAYVMLGVTRGASAAEITAAYRALAQIYHPDRYADAAPRVQAEANKRMQALNAAYEQLAVRGRPPSQPPPPPYDPPPAPPRREQPRPPTDDGPVLYVDGSPRYHNGTVAPLGFNREGDEVTPAAAAARCSKLDAELRDWFELQRTNASMVTKQMFASWTPDEQATYAAKLGFTPVPRARARTFGLPCPECRP